MTKECRVTRNGCRVIEVSESGLSSERLIYLTQHSTPDPPDPCLFRISVFLRERYPVLLLDQGPIDGFAAVR